MMKKTTHLAGFCLLMASLCILILAGCKPKAPQVPGLRVAGACDVLNLIGAGCNEDPPMLDWARQAIRQATGLNLVEIPSTNSLLDLKEGRADVALLGDEPDLADMVGIEDHLVAYDAVCLLIDTRTYHGGLQEYKGHPNQLVSKYAGLQNLSQADLAGLYSNMLKLKNEFWHLEGASFSYFTYQNYTDDSGANIIDPDNPDEILGMWIWNPVTLYDGLTIPGKFDTQTVVLKKLGYQGASLIRKEISLIPFIYDSEEELIASQFKIDPTAGQTVFPDYFNFTLLTVSRQVTRLAIQQGFAVRAISIDGIDPLGDPKPIYNGQYLLSRKIHVLTRRSASADADKLAQFFTSPDGQRLVEKLGYLPLP